MDTNRQNQILTNEANDKASVIAERIESVIIDEEPVLDTFPDRVKFFLKIHKKKILIVFAVLFAIYLCLLIANHHVKKSGVNIENAFSEYCESGEAGWLGTGKVTLDDFEVLYMYTNKDMARYHELQFGFNQDVVEIYVFGCETTGSDGKLYSVWEGAVCEGPSEDYYKFNNKKIFLGADEAGYKEYTYKYRNDYSPYSYK